MAQLFDPRMVTENPNVVTTQAGDAATTQADAVDSTPDMADLIALATLARGLDREPNFNITPGHPNINGLINSGLDRISQAAQSPQQRMFNAQIQQENRQNFARALRVMAVKRQQAQLANIRLQLAQQAREQEQRNADRQFNALQDYRNAVEENANRRLDLEANKQPRPTEEQSFVSDYLSTNGLSDTPVNRIRAVKAFKTLAQRPRVSTKFGPDNPAPQSAFQAADDAKNAGLASAESWYTTQVDKLQSSGLFGPDLQRAKNNLDLQLTAKKQDVQNTYEATIRKLGGSVNHYSYFNPTGQTEERVEVIAPDGQRGTIPASQIQQAKQKGYRVVGQ